MNKTIIDGLTKENYDSSVVQFKSLLKNQKCLKATVELVFEKAVEEPEKTSLLAAMCKELSSVKVPVENVGARTHMVYTTLKSLIITKCRERFMKTTLTMDKRKEEIEKRVANMKFLGDLYMNNVVTRSIMVFSIKYALERKEEETLKCLCEVLTTVGERLLNESTEPIDFIFNQIQDIIEGSETNISDCVKLQLSEILEVRKTWVVRNKSVKLNKQPQTQINTEKVTYPRRGFPLRQDKRNIEKRCARRQCYNLTYSSRAPRPSYAVMNMPKYRIVKPNIRKTSNVESAPVPGTSENSNIIPLTTDANRPFKDEPIPSTSSAIQLTVMDSPTSPETVIVQQETMPEHMSLLVKTSIDVYLVNLHDKEIVDKLKEIIDAGMCAALVTQIIDFSFEKSSTQNLVLSKLMQYLVTNNIVTPEDFVLGLSVICKCAPQMKTNASMVYLYIGKFMAPQIGKKYLNFKQIFEMSKNIITANQGPLLLAAVLNDLKDSKGASFVKSAWKESGILLQEWMNPDEIEQWLYTNELDFLDGA